MALMDDFVVVSSFDACFKAFRMFHLLCDQIDIPFSADKMSGLNLLQLIKHSSDIFLNHHGLPLAETIDRKLGIKVNRASFKGIEIARGAKAHVTHDNNLLAQVIFDDLSIQFVSVCSLARGGEP